ncbi:hypothetical protein SUGI_1181690 [Cryptomeria japonica]|uniref:uncharacterized protein LOC131034637 n=1 Tax=Cryptomeria japonica TaxID=3369 RepID=UPI0024147863|nr:uncharacterized protein LOC131034637 [Cryptomeria japonica]GLJ55054.1 hypothetical protein SUGI_1181690 [Cryptomeria japonica]
MLNVAAFSLVLLSLVTAGVWSPEPIHQAAQHQSTVKPEEPKVLVSEAHGVIVVEYERKGVLDAAKKGTHDAIHTAADYAELTGHNIRNAASQVEEAAEKAADVVGRGARKFEEAGEQAVHVIRSGADKTKDTVKSTAGKVKDKAASVLHHPGSEKEVSKDERVEGYVKNKPGEIYTSAKEKISEAVDSVRDAAAGAKERFKDRYHEATSHLPKVGQGIVNEENAELYGLYRDSNPESTWEIANVITFGEHIDKAGESLKDASRRLREVAAEKIEKIKTLKGEAQENYRENVESAGQGLTRSFQTVKEKADDAYDSAKDKVSGTGEKIRGTAEEAYDSAKGKLSGVGQNIKGGAEQTYDSAKGKVSDTGEKIKGSAGEAYNSTKGKISGTGQKIKEGAEQTYDSAKGKVSDTGEKIKGSTEEAYDSAKGKISSTGKKIKEGTEQSFDSAKGKVSDTVEILKESAGHTHDSAKGKVSGAGKKIKESAEQAFDSVKGRVADVGEKIKDDAKQTYDAAKGKVSGDGYKTEETLGKAYDSSKDPTSGGKDSQEFDHVEHGERILRIQRVLRHAGEVAIEKFRQAMDEAYGKSSNGSHLSENADDFETRTTNLLKDAVINLTDGSIKQSHLLPSRFERLPLRESMKVGTRILHLLAFSTLYGSSVWVNLLAGHVLAATIPRQQFALIQSKMYPLYFNTMAFGLSICLLTHPAIHPSKSEAGIQRLLGYNLLFSLLFTLANLLILEPRTTKVVFEKLRVEKEEGRGTDVADNTNEDNVLKCRIMRLNRKLKFLHRLSSLVNMLTFMSLSWHLVYLSSYIKDTVV